MRLGGLRLSTMPILAPRSVHANMAGAGKVDTEECPTSGQQHGGVLSRLLAGHAHIVQGRVCQQVGEVSRAVRAAIVSHPGMPDGEQVEPQHVHYPDLRQHRPKEIRPLQDVRQIALKFLPDCHSWHGQDRIHYCKGPADKVKASQHTWLVHAATSRPPLLPPCTQEIHHSSPGSQLPPCKKVGANEESLGL